MDADSVLTSRVLKTCVLILLRYCMAVSTGILEQTFVVFGIPKKSAIVVSFSRRKSMYIEYIFKLQIMCTGIQNWIIILLLFVNSREYDYTISKTHTQIYIYIVNKYCQQ